MGGPCSWREVLRDPYDSMSRGCGREIDIIQYASSAETAKNFSGGTKLIDPAAVGS